MHYFAKRAPDARAQVLYRRLHSQSPLEQWHPADDEWRLVDVTPSDELDPVRRLDFTRARAEVMSAWRAQRRRERHRRTPGA